MLRSRLFWKLLAAFTTLNAVGLVALSYASLSRQSAHAVALLEEQVQREIALLASSLPEGDATPAELQQLVAAAGEATGNRFMLIGADGEVLADSAGGGRGESAAGQLAQRPEVISALSGVMGVDHQGQGAEEGRVVHVAAPLEGRGRVAVVRATRRLADLGRQQSRLAWAYTLTAGAIGLLFCFGAAAMVRQVVRPVLSLNAAADAIARGDYHQRAFVPGNDELGMLARSFNRMSEDLGSQLVQLREGGQRQATVLGNMIEGVIATDDRERVLFANTAAGKLFGFIPPQIEGRPLLEVVRHHTLHQAVASGLSSGRPQRLEVEWEGPDLRILLVQVTPLPGDPCPGVVVVLHDTTELRRLESLRQDFVANVSHELKTPLSSIKAYAETLLDGALDDQEHNRKFLGRIEEQADRLTNLIQDLLALARIESAQQPFEIQEVAVADVVAACVEDYRNQAEAKQIDLVQQPQAPGLRVRADAEGLRVILNNLVDNAIKYTPAGGKVEVRWAQNGSGSTAIDVADTGLGIPKDALPRVFERFYRVDKARSRELGGTGLGLAIVKHLSQAFGGAVRVNSTEGSGTTFTVELPTA